jgi:hypothetical protein
MGYPEIMNSVGDDELYLEGAWLIKGKMPHEEASHLFIKKVIKKNHLEEYAKDVKKRYGIDRFNPVYIEK